MLKTVTVIFDIGYIKTEFYRRYSALYNTKCQPATIFKSWLFDLLNEYHNLPLDNEARSHINYEHRTTLNVPYDDLAMLLFGGTRMPWQQILMRFSDITECSVRITTTDLIITFK